MLVKKGSTDVSVTIRIVDSTDGTPETGVVWNTAGIDMQYRREGAASTAITEATLAALTTAHTDGGFLHIGNGYYRLDVPDAAFASGANGVLIHGTVTGMVVIGVYVQLTDVDIFDGVRGGMTALPNAAADAAGGLPISDAGGLDLDALNTAAVRLTAARAQIIDDWVNGGRLDLLLDAIKTVTDTQTAITPAALVDLVWDEVIAAGAHGIIGSAATHLRELSGLIFSTHTVVDASPTSSGFITSLAESDTDFWSETALVFTTGVLGGQSRIISGYNGSTKAVTFSEPFTSAPANGDSFQILAGHLHTISELQAGLATAADLAVVDANVDSLKLGIIFGAAATGTLSTTQATSDLTGYADDQLIGRIITVTSGVAEGESSAITDYASASGLLTFDAMTVAMGNGDTFKIT